jgi:hypothetical protein
MILTSFSTGTTLRVTLAYVLTMLRSKHDSPREVASSMTSLNGLEPFLNLATNLEIEMPLQSL